MNAIKPLIETYFEAYCRAESDVIAQVFHPECRLFSTDEAGGLERTLLSDWLGSLRGRKERGEFRSGGQLEIISVDETGDTAAAKAVIHFPESVFTDYLSLLRLNGKWRIIGKIYSVRILS